jgi:hypothetical protein
MADRKKRHAIAIELREILHRCKHLFHVMNAQLASVVLLERVQFPSGLNQLGYAQQNGPGAVSTPAPRPMAHATTQKITWFERRRG